MQVHIIEFLLLKLEKSLEHRFIYRQVNMMHMQADVCPQDVSIYCLCTKQSIVHALILFECTISNAPGAGGSGTTGVTGEFNALLFLSYAPA